MKAGWQRKRLRDACDIDRVQGIHAGLPYVGLEDIESHTARFIGSEQPTSVKSSTFRFSPEHVLYGRLRPYLNKVLAPDFEGHCSTEVFPLRPRVGTAREFVLYWLLREETVARANDTARGARMPRANVDAILDLEFLLPPRAEQDRIVGILDKTFEGIANAKTNAERNLESARAMFESQIASVFVAGASEWTPRQLAEVALDFGRGKSKHRPRNDPKLYGGKYPFIQTGDVRGADHLITEYSQTYNDLGLAQSKLWPAGTLCITIAANIAETGILGFDACFPDSVIGVVVNPKVTSNSFLEYLLQSVKARLKAQGKGSAQDNINLGTFEGQTFPFPDIKTQARIVANLDELREATNRAAALYEQKLAALNELKNSVLHYAFAGAL